MPGIDKYTKLMLHCNGADASQVFIDSATGKVVTAVNHAQIDTVQSKFGGASGLFDGTDDYLTLADSSDFNLGLSAEPFTIDCWIRTTDTTFGIVGRGSGTYAWNNTTGIQYHLIYGGGILYFQFWNNVDNGQAFITSNVPKDGSWHHIAVIYDGTTTKIAIDGTFSGTTTTDNYYKPSSANNFIVGVVNGLIDYFAGWFDEIRVSKGIARWTANFTPPVSAYIRGGNALPFFM